MKQRISFSGEDYEEVDYEEWKKSNGNKLELKLQSREVQEGEVHYYKKVEPTSFPIKSNLSAGYSLSLEKSGELILYDPLDYGTILIREEEDVEAFEKMINLIKKINLNKK